MLGRRQLRNLLDNLHGAAMSALFADPRLRTRKIKLEAESMAPAGCIALAGWAGFGAGGNFSSWKAAGCHTCENGSSQKTVARYSELSAARSTSTKPKPPPPKFAQSPAKIERAGSGLVASNTGTTLVVPPLPNIRVEPPPVQKAVPVAPVNLTAAQHSLESSLHKSFRRRLE